MAYLSETGLAYFWKKARKKLYPVGTVYQTSGDTNPSELFGGTWEKISSHASHTFINDENEDVFSDYDRITPRTYDSSFKMTFSGDVVNVTARFKLQLDRASDTNIGLFKFSKWFSSEMPELYVHGVVETGKDAGRVMTFKIDSSTGEITLAGSNYYNDVYINLAFTFVVPGLETSDTFNTTYGNSYTLWKRTA